MFMLAIQFGQEIILLPLESITTLRFTITSKSKHGKLTFFINSLF